MFSTWKCPALPSGQHAAISKGLLEGLSPAASAWSLRRSLVRRAGQHWAGVLHRHHVVIVMQDPDAPSAQEVDRRVDRKQQQTSADDATILFLCAAVILLLFSKHYCQVPEDLFTVKERCLKHLQTLLLPLHSETFAARCRCQL